jgi:hypothetical protein
VEAGVRFWRSLNGKGGLPVEEVTAKSCAGGWPAAKEWGHLSLSMGGWCALGLARHPAMK